jgi:ribonuclease HI
MKLKRVQALALKIMSGALPGTPFESLDNIADIPGIEVFLKGEAAKGAARLQSYRDWTGETAPTGKGFIKAHTTINNQYIADLELPRAERDLTKPMLTLHRSYTLEYPTGNHDDYKSGLQEVIERLPSTTITCYTDGSRTDCGTGYGYMITTNNNAAEVARCSAKMPEYSSVFQAELSAISAAAEELKDYTDREIIFLSDSMASLQALSSKIIKSKTVIRCHEALDSLAIHNTVKVMWIEAHKGHWGNEHADKLAKDGTNCENLVRGYLPQSYIKQAIYTNTKKVSEAVWSNTSHSHTRLTLGINTKTTKHDLNILMKDRDSYRIAVQLITGHATLNYHLHKMSLVASKICPYCEGADETVAHFLGQCPAFASLRGEYFNTHYSSLADIFGNHSIIVIVRYATKTKRFLRQEDKDQGGVT